MGNPISYFYKYRPKRSKKNQLGNYVGLYEKTAVGFDFGPRVGPKLENMHFHFQEFSGWGTSRGPKLNPKAVFP